MARNPLTRLLQHAFAEAAKERQGHPRPSVDRSTSAERSISVDRPPSVDRSISGSLPVSNGFQASGSPQVSGGFPASPESPPASHHLTAAHSRRSFIKDASLATAGLLIPPILKPGSPRSQPDSFENKYPSDNSSGNSEADPLKVAIVGAGMAGLNAAWQLKRKGISATVFEAADRIGGRMFTLKDKFGPGITTDIGGEFVDSSHTDILELVKALGLECYDLRQDTLAHKTFWFDGRLLGERDLREAILPYTDQLLKDIQSLPPVISHVTADSFRHLDQISILDYLRNIGISGWLFHFLDIVLTREYGMESAQQSAINFLIMFEPPAAAEQDYELFGQDHEVFKIKGGSQHLCDKLYEQVQDQVHLRQKLVRLDPNGQGGYELLFEEEGGRKKIQADQVILTLPFTILRSLTLNIPMPAEKRRCIDQIGYGNSCKFIMGMDGKPWRKAGMQGYSFTDLAFGCGWDSSQSQSENTGSFTVFGGGNFADWVQLTKKEDLTLKLLPALDTIYKGAATSYNGRSVKFCWTDNRYSRAGYSAFKTGQWSTLAGWEGVPLGQVHFAGEHVSREFQGYMNGAAQTGRIAAEAVAANLINHTTPLDTESHTQTPIAQQQLDRTTWI